MAYLEAMEVNLANIKLSVTEGIDKHAIRMIQSGLFLSDPSDGPISKSEKELASYITEGDFLPESDWPGVWLRQPEANIALRAISRALSYPSDLDGFSNHLTAPALDRRVSRDIVPLMQEFVEKNLPQLSG